MKEGMLMKASVNANFLNCIEHVGRDKDKKYYTLSFLDEDDNSYNCYINEALYTYIKNMNVKRYASVVIELNIYKGRDGNYNFSPTDLTVSPFEEDNKLANKHAGNTTDSKSVESEKNKK